MQSPVKSTSRQLADKYGVLEDRKCDPTCSDPPAETCLKVTTAEADCQQSRIFVSRWVGGGGGGVSGRDTLSGAFE